MREIDNIINKHSKNSLGLKRLYIGNKSLKYDKSVELMKQQDIEYKKMEFFKKLKEEMGKNGK